MLEFIVVFLAIFGLFILVGAAAERWCNLPCPRCGTRRTTRSEETAVNGAGKNCRYWLCTICTNEWQEVE